jgi:type II secretory pathway pseudopilin PulG
MTVVAIIAILIGILIPALAKVRTMVKETQQKAQLNTIGLALTAFRNDYGDYPPSDYIDLGQETYSGAQMLSEALLGWDLMGFHPKSAWRADGKDSSDNDLYEIATDSSYTPQEQEQNLKERKDIYLQDGTKYAFEIGDLFTIDNKDLDPNTFVICDVFDDFQKIGQTRIGAPILYYKANTNNKTIDYKSYKDSDLIYNANDNLMVIKAKEEQDGQNIEHPLGAVSAGEYKQFYDFIRDPKIPDPSFRPYRPDTYLLISAGADGIYGTNDDITNFK